jgi:hypothetical protein
LFVVHPRNRAFLNIKKEYEEVRKLGCHIVCLHPLVSLRGKIPLWYPRGIGEWVPEFKEKLRSRRNPGGHWLRSLLEDCADQVGYWEAFAHENNVVIFQQMTEYSMDTVSIRMAMDRVGGIELGKMRSQFFDLSSAAFYFQHEIAMVWHHNVVKYLRNSSTDTEMIVECGYIYDNMFKAKEVHSRNLRERLEASDVTTVLTIYDNYPHLNGHFDENQLEGFYRIIIDVINKYSWVGLIVKSKKPQVLDQKLPRISLMLEEISSLGRCIILKKALTSIAPSALAADLVVGIPCSTAVCEAAIIGRRVVMFDPSGIRDHVLAGAPNIVYGDLKSFQAAIHSYLESPHTSKVGDAVPLRTCRAIY